MKKRIISTLATALLLAGFTVHPANAQTTYQTWDDPNEPSAQSSGESVDGGKNAGAGERLKSFIERLNALLTQAEKDKAADPLFLRDLRALVLSSENPWPNLVLHDDFSDGNFDQNPAWTVGAGRYFIEKGWGIRNAVDTVSTSSGVSNDPALNLLATIFGKAIGANTATSSSAGAIKAQPTSVFTDVAISNAFAMEILVSSWIGDGQLTVGPYQGKSRNTGYRLIYHIGGNIDLVAKSSSGARTIDTANGPFVLEDKKVHAIRWTRDKNGNMVVTWDDNPVFQLRDVSFRDPFVGFGMATSGGDFIVKSVNISSAPE